jgi:hypothetical protein
MSAVDIITRGYFLRSHKQCFRPDPSPFAALATATPVFRPGIAAAPRQRSEPHRRRSRAADAASRAADKKGVGYWVVVGFDMNILDFLVTLNVTVSRMINWRNTASQIGHTVTK